MSPAQLQLALALVERAAEMASDSYLDACGRSHELFEEMMRVNALREQLRAEVETAGKVPVVPVVPVCPSNGEVA